MKEKECNNEIIYVGASVFVFVYGKINLQHNFSINNHQWKFSYILLLYFPLEASMSSPLPTKKHAGRPTKLYISDQVGNMIAKYLDFH